MKRLRHLAPADILRFAPLLFIFLVLLFVLTESMTTEIVMELVAAASVGIVYLLLIQTPFLKGHKSVAEMAHPLVALGNTLVITLVVTLLAPTGEAPMIAFIYLISIAAVAIRCGLGPALWTAFLSALGYLTALTLAGLIRQHIADVVLTIGMFFVIGILTGLLAEDARRRAREYENLMTRNREAILILDAAGCFEYLNPAALALVDYRADELLGRPFLELVADEDRATVRKNWDLLSTRPAPRETFQVRVQRKDGAIRILSTTIANLDSDPPRYMIIARDITEQETERAAHARRNRELEAERAVAQAVSQTLDLKRVLDLALDQVLAALQVDGGAIYLTDDAQTELTLATARNLPASFAARVMHFRFGEGITGHAAAQREAILVPDLDQDARCIPEVRAISPVRSQISVPLIALERVVGVLNASSSESNRFDEEDLALLRTIAASVAIAINHARLFETLEQRVKERTAELATLNRIASAVNQSLDLDAILNAAVDELTQMSQVRNAWVRLLDPVKGELILRATRDRESTQLTARSTFRTERLSERVIQDGQARATNVGDADLNVRGALLAAGIHSLAVVPLSVADSVVGVLGVGSEEPDRFGEAELRWLNAVGNTIAVALENARLYQSAVQAAERRETLHWLGQEIVGASLDPERVYLATHRAAAKLMPSEAFAIAILDELRQEIEAVYLVDRSGRCPKQRIPMARGLSGRVVSTGQPLLIDDFDQVSDRLDTVHFGDPTHVRSILAVPMRLGGKIFGMLSAQSYTPRAYTIEDLNVLEMLAAHAAIALDNARLFEAEQRRRESAQALLEIAVASASNLDLLQTLRQIALQTARACRVNRCSIFLLDATGENLKPIMSQFANGHTDWEQWQRFRQTPPEPVVSSPVFAQPMRDQKPVVVESAQQVARLPSRWIEPFGIRRLFAVPLVSRGRAIGLMVLDDVESEEPFTAEQIDLATTIGAQVTAAIENARLFEAVQRQAEEAETLRQAGSVVVATLQPEEAIARILQQLARVVPYDSASVQLLRDGYVEIVGGRGWPDLAAVLGMRFPVPGDNPNTVVIQQRKPYILEKAPAAHAPFREEPHSHIQSWLGVPLIVHDQVIGMLAVDSTQPSYFTDDHARLASAFANQVAIALENVRLSETARQNAAELEAVRQATLSLTKSLDLHQVLDAILENALRLMAGAKDAHIFLYAAERGGHLTFGASRWYDGRTGQPWAMPRPQGLTITVARQGQAIVVPDMSKHPLFSDAPPPWRTGAIVGLPLKIGERVVGVMNVAYALAHAFSESELRMLRLLGDQAAIAIENARLFESVERRVAQLATLREIDRGLSAMLNFAPMLETMLSHLGQIVPYDSAAVFLLDDHSLRAVAARGRDQTALAQFALDASDSAIFHQMAQTRAPIVFDDLGEHPEWVAVPGMEWARAWIGVPLIARGEMIGQIGVFSATPHAFTREHSDLLLAFANHAAIAIANARLHAELNEQARRDSLTQVLNHGAFVTELRAAGEQGEPLALIMLDLDNFKQYNDTYGHTVGDAVLCATVHAIRAHVKHTDFVGRWGGEEFAIALRGADTARAARVATRIRATLAATPITDRQGNAIPPPTASQGIAALPGTARDVDDLIENADRALYRAKARGRDQVACAE